MRCGAAGLAVIEPSQGSQLGSESNLPNLLLARRVPVIGIRPQLAALPRPDQQRIVKPPESNTPCRTTPACRPAGRFGWAGWR